MNGKINIKIILIIIINIIISNSLYSKDLKSYFIQNKLIFENIDKYKISIDKIRQTPEMLKYLSKSETKKLIISGTYYRDSFIFTLHNKSVQDYINNNRYIIESIKFLKDSKIDYSKLCEMLSYIYNQESSTQKESGLDIITAVILDTFLTLEYYNSYNELIKFNREKLGIASKQFDYREVKFKIPELHSAHLMTADEEQKVTNYLPVSLFNRETINMCILYLKLPKAVMGYYSDMKFYARVLTTEPNEIMMLELDYESGKLDPVVIGEFGIHAVEIKYILKENGYEREEKEILFFNFKQIEGKIE